MQAHLSGAKDITVNQPIVVCPIDHAGCKAEMEAIEQSARDAANVNAENPMLPLATIVRATDPEALKSLGVTVVGGAKRPIIE